jgi:hypothetical protein
MVLENFLIDVDVLWDRAGKELYEKQQARAGRKMRVRVTNKGLVEDLTGYTLNLGWKSTIDETKFGLDAFAAVDITKGIFEIAYTSGMLTNIGTLVGTLQLVPSVGNATESNNFMITVKKSAVDAESMQSETSFTALVNALVSVNDWNARIDAVEADFIARANNLDATYPTRLLSAEQQLAQTNVLSSEAVAKADAMASGSPKGVYATLALLQAAYPTGTTGAYLVTADGKWYYWSGSAWTVGGVYQSTGIAEKSQNINILTVSKLGKNLFDKTLLLSNTSLTTNGGTMVSAGNNVTSYYIDALESTSYAFTSVQTVAWYDSNKVFISYAGVSVNGIVTSPVSAFFARLQVTDANLNIAQMEVGAIKTEYLPFTYIIPKAYTEKQTIEVVDVPILPFAKADYIGVGKNLFDESKKTVGSFVSNTNGTVSTNATYDVTDFIEISPNLNYAISGVALANTRVAFYNENKIFISGIYPTVNPVVSPATAKYVRFSFNTGNKAQIEQADTSTLYEPYGLRIPKMLHKKDDLLLFLPSEICVAVGRTIEIYNNQVAWCGNIDNYHFQWDCTIGKAMKRKFSITGISGLIGEYTLTLNVFDNNMIGVTSKTTTLKIVSNVIANPKNVLSIGDSLTNGKAWLGELRTLSADKLSMVGTRGTSPLKHEGRSGFSAVSYLTATTYSYEGEGVQPFWDASSSRFNWSYYKTTYGIVPDAVQIFLGTNNLILDPTANANAIKQIVDYIRQDDPAIPIFLVFTLYGGNQDGIGVQISVDGYAADKGAWKLSEDRMIFNLMDRLYTLLSGYSNLHFVPIALCHDSENNFGSLSTPVNPRASQTELLPTEATHPQTQGYLQMADIMFSTMSKYLA